jgi:hypothetical protein
MSKKKLEFKKHSNVYDCINSQLSTTSLYIEIHISYKRMDVDDERYTGIEIFQTYRFFRPLHIPEHIRILSDTGLFTFSCLVDV